MKKWIALILILALCIPLGGCQKSEAVKNVETMIASLDDATLFATADAFNALSESEQSKVKNVSKYEQEIERYFEQHMVGTWYPFALNAASPQSIFEPEYSLTLNADHTVESRGYGTTHGEWIIKKGKLMISGIGELITEHSSKHYTESSFTLDFLLNDGKAWLKNDIYARYLKEDDYFDAVAEVIKAVDCETDDLSEVFGFASFEYHTTDEWGAHTGNVYQYVGLQNKLYEQGWYYISESNDFAVEVCYPSYKEYFTFESGATYVDKIEANSYTISENPFNYLYRPLQLSWTYPDQTVTTDLDLDTLSIGRSKGKIYFINQKYVKDITHDDTSRTMHIEVPDSEDQFLGAEAEIYFSVFEENNQLY